MIRRGGTILVSVAAFALPAAASADTVSISASADPVAEIPYQITISGSVSSSKEVYASIKATGGPGCGANPSADQGTSSWEEYPSAGPFSFVENHTSDTPGTYLLCAWTDTSSSDPPTANAEQVITVRAPHAVGSVTAPAQAIAGKTIQITATAQTEVEREVFVEINRPGVACGANVAANQTSSTAISQDNRGGPFTYTANYEVPTDVSGLYRLCGYIQDSSSSTVPDAVFGGQFLVISRSCVHARASVAKYQRAYTAAVARAHRLRSRAAHATRATARRRLLHLAALQRRDAKALRKLLRHWQTREATACPTS